MYVLVKFLFWISIWPIFEKENIILVFYLKCFDCDAVALSASFPLVSLKERCLVIVSIPYHCLLFYFIGTPNTWRLGFIKTLPTAT